ncbi:MAG: 1-acyl-sn-glycerol-3-phosphate acyltransferase [Bacilli bacterium]|nr:1-acyl-sn-glycerol-3-phosphate acyltransferase [Bacilli bacterium]
MIIGGSKKEVIENIKKNIEEENFNNKVEIGDPNLSEEEIDALINSFYKNRKNVFSFFFKNKIANMIVDYTGKQIYKDIEIKGFENLKDLDLSKGAIITCNHFNPLDSYNLRKVVKKLKKKLYIVVQATNLALPKHLGFLMNNLNTLPLKNSPNYIINTLKPKMKKVLEKGNIILIYPEEEMWFNYRKPRPTRRGAYQFASEFKVPVISCFVEIKDTDISDNEEFNQVKYVVHVLKPLLPDNDKSDRQNSIELSRLDYEQKKVSYEEAYKIKLDYKFSYDDIAGWKKD